MDAATFPTLDLSNPEGSFRDYPIHDRDAQLEFVLGMWFNTRALVGKPTVLEVALTLPDWPVERRQQLLETLARNGQVAA